MARPIWKGHISFGLVNIPVTLFSQEERSEEISFHMIDKSNNARVRQQRVNEATGEKVEWGDIVKGYAMDDGSYIIVPEEELDKFAVESSQAVEIEEFVDSGEIDFSFFAKPYYLVPAKKGDKGYVLLREALKKAGKIGIAKVVLRTREYLSALIPDGDALMLYILRYSYELREVPSKDIPHGSLDDYKISDKEMDIAAQLIDTMVGEWEPEKFKDDYRDALMNWIEEAARTGKNLVAPTGDGEDEEATEVLDIMSLLKQSMDQAKSGDKKKKKA